MKQSRRTPSHRTTPRADAPQHASAASEDQRGAAPDAPLSLQSGAGRQYWDEVLRLLVHIRADCDAAAERLGYASHQDDGLAAIEYIANKILQAVRTERWQQQIAPTKNQPAPRPPDVQSPKHARDKADQRTRPAGPAEHSERSRLIGELKQMLREGKTRSGLVIGPALAHDIAKHITVLNDAVSQPETPQSMQRIRASLARFFGKVSGSRNKPAKSAAAVIAEKSTLATKTPSHVKQTVTKRSVTKGAMTKGPKRSKRRPR